jgi:hypothetical protein
MRVRWVLIAATVLAAVGAIVGVIVSGGGDEADEPKAATRAVGLGVDRSGRAFAAVERLDAGRWRLAIAPVRDGGGLDDARAVDIPIDRPAAIAAQGDNTLLVAGDRVVDGRRELAVARVTTAGRIDRSFGRGGVATFAAGDGDVVARGVAAHPRGGVVISADASEAGDHALAIVRTDADGRDAQTDSVPNVSAGGAATDAQGGALVAGTGTGDGSAVLVRLAGNGAPRVTRASTPLTSASWRAVAATGDGGAVLVGSGRDATQRSLVAVQPFGGDGNPTPARNIAVGRGDAYGEAVRVDRGGRIVVGADGVESDAPAAFVVTIAADGTPARTHERRTRGRLAGLTPERGVLTTDWDGERQTVQFAP